MQIDSVAEDSRQLPPAGEQAATEVGPSALSHETTVELAADIHDNLSPPERPPGYIGIQTKVLRHGSMPHTACLPGMGHSDWSHVLPNWDSGDKPTPTQSFGSDIGMKLDSCISRKSDLRPSLALNNQDESQILHVNRGAECSAEEEPTPIRPTEYARVFAGTEESAESELNGPYKSTERDLWTSRPLQFAKWMYPISAQIRHRNAV